MKTNPTTIRQGDVLLTPVYALPAGCVEVPNDRGRIVLAYDSANRYLRAWRFDAHGATLTPLWEKSPFGCASHMLLYPDSGELVINDHRQFGEQGIAKDRYRRTDLAAFQVAGDFRPAGTTVTDDDLDGNPAMPAIGIDQVHAVEDGQAGPAPLSATLQELLEYFVVRIVARDDPSHRCNRRATGA